MDPFEKQKRDAQRAFAEAVFDGYLKPPTHCPSCSEHTVVTGHHFDYARPLDVHWLCYWCHFCEHQKQLGLPVPTRRRSPIPTYRAPRVRQPSKRSPGRPRDVERYTRPRPEPRSRTYGEYLGHSVVRRNGRPALRDPQHPLARSGFVYVEDLLLLDQLGRLRQFGDSVTYRDGNRWNWDPHNIIVQTVPGDPHVRVSIYAPDCAHFEPVDLPHGAETHVQTIIHEGRAGFQRPGRAWLPQEATRIFNALASLAIPLRVHDLRRSIADVAVSNHLPDEWPKFSRSAKPGSKRGPQRPAPPEAPRVRKTR